MMNASIQIVPTQLEVVSFYYFNFKFKITFVKRLRIYKILIWTSNSNSCQCDLSNYQPLCVNDLTYYSTCYAGCNSANISEIEKCSCVPPAPSLSVSSGRCKEKSGCKSSVYLGLTFFLVFFTFVHGAPVGVRNSLLIYRVVQAGKWNLERC